MTTRSDDVRARTDDEIEIDRSFWTRRASAPVALSYIARVDADRAVIDQLRRELAATDDQPTILDRFALAVAGGPFTHYMPPAEQECVNLARMIYGVAEALNEERIRRNQATKVRQGG
jgi:hypothetical protein